MGRTVIYFNNAQLAKINPAFSTTRPGWTQRVEAIYTDNKADPLWKGGETASGITLAATVREQTRFLNGIIALDLSTFLTPVLSLVHGGFGRAAQGQTQMVSSKPGFNEVRKKVLNTLTHELLHVLQGWVWGDEWGNKYAEARLDAIGKDFFRDLAASQNRLQPYSGYKNRYELAAFRFGNEWINHNSEAINAGAYDEFIPVDKIRELLNNMKFK
jgi:hypothetical protein